MPIRSISLTQEQSEFVDSVVETGEYQDASEAIRDAVRALQYRRREDELKLKALRALVTVGIEAIEAGDFINVKDENLDDYLASLVEGPVVA